MTETCFLCGQIATTFTGHWHPTPETMERSRLCEQHNWELRWVLPYECPRHTFGCRGWLVMGKPGESFLGQPPERNTAPAVGGPWRPLP